MTPESANPRPLRIALVNPPLSAKEQAGSFANVANVMPPLGIGYIAAVLLRAGFDATIIDCRPRGIAVPDLIASLAADRPDIIGFTATVLEVARANEISRALKERLPETLLVLGGPHVTTLPEETLARGAFDLAVIGEGEQTMLEIAVAVRERRLDPTSIPGVAYRRDGHIVLTPPRPYIQDLDAMPFPARHLYPPLAEYRPIPASYRRLPLGHVMTSRGCPFQCIFCDRKVFGNHVRMRSPANVVDEIQELVEVHGAREVKFFDDTFTLDNDRIAELCAELGRRGLRIPWSCLTRANLVTAPLLMTMKQAGCWQVAFGLESGDPEMLKRMKKGITVEQGRAAVLAAHAAGLNVRAYFVLGMPGETLASIRRTVEFAKSLPIDALTFYVLTLYPGNELYAQAKREGRILHEDYTQFNPIPDVREGRLAYLPEGITEPEFKHAIARAHRDFYLRPGYIARQLLAVRGPGDLVRYWRGFLAIIGM
jgi:anaerobic magnesium-protoporphyrin IX monomethyl ester cyclase